VFLAAYAIPIINPDIPAGLAQACRVAVWVIWALIGAEFIVRVALAERRPHYILRHWFDVLIITLPLLRPLRLLRMASVLRVLNRRAIIGLRGRVAIYVAGGATLLAFCGALAVLDAERDSSSANIADFGDAMWWAVTTMTTVGYGDRYPTTGEGRLGAAALMVAGIALLGTVTVTLASWLIEQASSVEEKKASDVRTEIELISLKIDHLLSQHSKTPLLSRGEEPFGVRLDRHELSPEDRVRTVLFEAGGRRAEARQAAQQATADIIEALRRGDGILPIMEMARLSGLPRSEIYQILRSGEATAMSRTVVAPVSTSAGLCQKPRFSRTGWAGSAGVGARLRLQELLDVAQCCSGGPRRSSLIPV